MERRGWRQRVPVPPNEVTTGGIDRLDHVAGMTQIHHAVVDKRRGLVDAGLHGACPDQLQTLDVGLVDLIERTVAPGLIIAAMHQPIFGLGRSHHLVGHPDEVRYGSRRARGRGRLLGVPRQAEGAQQGSTQQ